MLDPCFLNWVVFPSSFIAQDSARLLPSSLGTQDSAREKEEPVREIVLNKDIEVGGVSLPNLTSVGDSDGGVSLLVVVVVLAARLRRAGGTYFLEGFSSVSVRMGVAFAV
ncbi:MAG: hypothetical protein A3J38_03890 [Gammaproteobacteria bacterium RIFCSPHIGHO2_12_FULL_45_9]|nr:MAG: hypothetical protein A3J38_03890 [Gammaproteobacteria bacterium RIFCSPHIGHO2_12_FULL_45_9]